MSQAYLGNYSNNSFNAAKRYLMQFAKNKQIADTDLLNIQNISQSTIRQLISANFPSGSSVNNGFKVVESTTNGNNFKVKGGDGTVEGVGVLFVDGYILFLKSDIEYNQQNNSGAITDDNYTESTIPLLTTPGTNRTDEVYVDFYFAEVSGLSGSEYLDDTLLVSGLGQTANRLRQVQDIRVVEGGITPANGFDVNGIYHRHVKIAILNRLSGNANILTSMIVDNRTIVSSNEKLSIDLSSHNHGIGTDNYLSKFNGTSTFENSQIIDTGTNIGIGTTNPTSKLHVQGDVSVSGNLLMSNSNSTANIAGVIYKDSLIERSVANSTLILSGGVNSQGAQIILAGSQHPDSPGDMVFFPGLISTNPDVSGSFLFYGSIKTYSNIVGAGGNDSDGLQILSNGVAYLACVPEANGDTKASISLRDISTLAQGIGGGIAFAGNNGVTIATKFAGIKAYKSNNISGNNSGQLHFQTRLNGSNPMTKMIIDENGNVGIGTLTAITKLVVQGDVTVSGLTASQIVETDANKKLISVAKATGYNLALGTIAGTIAQGNHNHGTGTDNYLSKFNGTSAFENSIIYDNGTNVGIGTENPQAKFHVQGDVLISSNLTVNGTTTTVNTEAISTDMFTINQDDNQPALVVNQTNAGNNATVMTISNAGTGNALIIENGNVGIGTTNPQAKLHIQGDIIVNNISANTLVASQIVETDANKNLITVAKATGYNLALGTTTGTIAQGDHNHGSGTDNYILKFNGTSAFENSQIIDNGTNIGIGTTVPLAKLDISNGALCLVLGADDNANSRTNNTVKYARVGAMHYVNAEEPMAMIYGISNSATNTVYIGGNTTQMNSATEISFHTAVNNTTVTGTQRFSILSDGTIKTLGNYINNNGTAIKGLKFETNNVPYIVNSQSISGDSNRTLFLQDDRSFALGIGGGIAFEGKVNTGGTYSTLASIKGYKANATDGNNAGQLHFQTVANVGTPITKMVINENGNVGIGTTVPLYELDVNGTVNVIESIQFSKTASSSCNLNVAQFFEAGGTTGTIKIKLPKSWANTMLKFNITGYDFTSTTAAWECSVSGYTQTSNSTWTYTSCTLNGKPPFTSVRLGHDGDTCCILLGTISTAWSWNAIYVDVYASHIASQTGWNTGYTISRIVDETGITVSATPIILNTGTTNYLPKFTDGPKGLVGDSTVFNNSGLVGISTSVPLGTLDISSGATSLVIGADSNTTTRTNATTKVAKIVSTHYTNTEEPISMLVASNSSAANEIFIGGGSSLLNAANTVYISTAPTTSTLTGTVRFAVQSDGIIRTYGNYINNTGTANKGMYFDANNIPTIVNTPSISGDAKRLLVLQDDTAVAASVGGGIIFGGKYTGSTYTVFAGIKGIKSNATDGNQAGQLHFQTNPNGTVTTKMIIDENGNIGIGTGIATAKLDINGNANITATLTFQKAAGIENHLCVTHYQNAGSPTGTLKIKLPKTWSDTMLRIKITGYDYTFGSWECTVSGYSYVTETHWHTSSAQINGKPPFTSVRMGHDGTTCCILLGITTTAWSFPSIYVDCLAGYSNLAGFETGWSTSMITDETGITISQTPIFYNTGTSGYIVRYQDGAKTLFHNSQIFDSGSSTGVGIGTSSPSAKLDISNGQMTMLLGADTGSDSRTNLTDKTVRIASIHNTNAEEPVGMMMAINTAAANNLYFGGATSYNNTATDIYFYTAANVTTTVGSERMRINSSGNIGIGTTNPLSKLHVNGTIVSQSLVIDTAAASAIIYVNTVDGSDNKYLGLTGANDIGNSRAAFIKLYGNEVATFGGRAQYSTGTAAGSYHEFLTSGIVVGAPTGGHKGVGTINAQAVYDDNVLLTGYVLDKYVSGENFNISDWDKKSTTNVHVPAREFIEQSTLMFDINEYYKFVVENKTLPTFDEIEKSKEIPSTGTMIQKLWEVVEIQSIHIKQLNDRIELLESKLKNI